MSSQRSANFSRLKELLPSIRPSQLDQSETDLPTHSKEDLRLEVAETQIQAIGGTAAVQQLSLIEQGRSSLVAKPGRPKPLTRPSTFRLAVELQDALKSVADYNCLNMTEIVAEGIWLHLQNFDWPPGLEPTREKLKLLF